MLKLRDCHRVGRIKSTAHHELPVIFAVGLLETITISSPCEVWTKDGCEKNRIMNSYILKQRRS